jgi:PAS domain S-box-containing protein
MLPDNADFDSTQAYKIIIEEAPLLAALYTGPEIRIRFANKLMLEAWGKDESVIGKPIREANPEWEGQPFFNYFDKVFATGVEHVSRSEEAVLSDWQGVKTRYYNFSYKPLKTDDGSVWGIVHTATDVTEEVIAKKGRDESERNFRNIIHHSPIATCIYSGPEFVLTLANRRMLQLMGKTEEEALNKPMAVGLPEVKGEGYEQILQQVYRTGIEYEAREQRASLPRNGRVETVYVNFTYTPIRNGEGQVTDILAMAYEVSEEIRSRKILKENEERLNLAVENAEAGVYDTNLLTGESIRSARHAQIFGYHDNKGEWTLAKMMTHVVPEDVSLVEEQLAKAVDTGVVNATFRIIRLDGKTRWIQIKGKVHYNSQGKAYRILGTTVDITEKKELERQKDEFISIVSHELKTPVTSIKAYSQLLQRSLAGEENLQNRSFLERLDTQVNRLQTLIMDLLEVTRLESGKTILIKSRFEMHMVLAELIADLQVVTPTHKLIITENNPTVVEADKNRIIQVITNLVTNAVKYSPGQDKVHIALLNRGDDMVCSVKDFGIGIPEDQKTLVFDRFHQAANHSEKSGLSLGLGLYIAHEIVEREGGKIWFESTVGEGTTFYFSLSLKA